MNRPHNPDSDPNSFPDPDATWNPPEIIPPTDGDKPLPLPSPPPGGKPPAPARHGSGLTLPYDQSHDRMGLAHDSSLGWVWTSNGYDFKVKAGSRSSLQDCPKPHISPPLIVKGCKLP